MGGGILEGRYAVWSTSSGAPEPTLDSVLRAHSWWGSRDLMGCQGSKSKLVTCKANTLLIVPTFTLFKNIFIWLFQAFLFTYPHQTTLSAFLYVSSLLQDERRCLEGSKLADNASAFT